MTKKFYKLKKLFIIIILLILFILLGLSYNFFMKKAYPIEYNNHVFKYSNDYNVDPALIYAIIKTESNFNTNAESPAGAIGLMQIMPNTFYWLQAYTNDKYMDIKFLNYPEINIKYGTYFINMLLDKYKSDIVAICAYNAGIGTIDKWLTDPSLSYDGKSLAKIPYKETKQYVKRVIKNREIYKYLYFNK